MEKIKKAVKYYTSNGLPVFPCGIDKKPLTEHGFHDASMDVGLWPDKQANIGIPTGHETNLFVLDVDVKAEDGMASLKELERIHGKLPPTLTIRTWSGGLQYWFKCPKAIKSATKVRPGIDIRADGGYVIAPPSWVVEPVKYPHLVGATYKFINFKNSPIIELTSIAPDWVYELKREAKMGLFEGTQDGVSGNGTPPEIIKEGSRNDTLIRLAGKLRRTGLSGGALKTALIEENRLRVMPPLGIKEVESIAQNCEKYRARDSGPKSTHEFDFNYVPLSTFDETMERPREWLYDKMLSKPSLAMLAAPEKSGKSNFAIQIGISLAAGVPFLGFSAPSPRKTLYLQKELGEDTLAGRINEIKFLWDKEIIEAAEKNNLFEIATIPPEIKLCADSKWLERELSNKRPDLVILDTLSRFISADINKETELKPIIDMVQALAIKYQVCLLFIHHFRKGQGQGKEETGNLFDLFRGSKVWVEASDELIGFEPVYKKMPPEMMSKRDVHIVRFRSRTCDPSRPFYIYREPESLDLKRFDDGDDLLNKNWDYTNEVIQIVTENPGVGSEEICKRLSEYISRRWCYKIIKRAMDRGCIKNGHARTGQKSSWFLK